jgi:hypothetical protein
MESESTLAGTARGRVQDPIAAENLDAAVIHADRQRKSDYLLWFE